MCALQIVEYILIEGEWKRKLIQQYINRPKAPMLAVSTPDNVFKPHAYSAPDEAFLIGVRSFPNFRFNFGTIRVAKEG